MSTQGSAAYDALVAITRDYLGPSAQRFIDRQISAHLSKQPGTLTYDDIPQLIDWATIAMAVLTQNTVLVKEYTERLKKIV